MRRSLLRNLLFILTLVMCSAGSQAFTAQQATPAVQAAQKSGTDDGKVYRESDVDVEAKSSLKELEVKNFEQALSGCPPNKTLEVRLKLVFSRIGKVTDVKVLKEEPKCGLADALTKDVRALSFIPAVKRGRAVSVYRNLQIIRHPKKN